LTNPPVLVPPQHGKPFRLYLSTDDAVIGTALIQEYEGKERVIYYLSRRLVDAEKLGLMSVLFLYYIKALFAIGRMYCHMQR